MKVNGAYRTDSTDLVLYEVTLSCYKSSAQTVVLEDKKSNEKRPT